LAGERLTPQNANATRRQSPPAQRCFDLLILSENAGAPGRDEPNRTAGELIKATTRGRLSVA
jgi:hypothetical protein